MFRFNPVLSLPCIVCDFVAARSARGFTVIAFAQALDSGALCRWSKGEAVERFRFFASEGQRQRLQALHYVSGWLLRSFFRNFVMLRAPFVSPQSTDSPSLKTFPKP